VNSADDDFLKEAVRRGFIREGAIGRIESRKIPNEDFLTPSLPTLLEQEKLLQPSQVDAILGNGRPRSLGRFGPYEILRLAGEGMAGTVYDARRDDAPERRVALKIANSVLMADPEGPPRFRREAEFLVRLKHPNIVRGYEFGECNGTLFVAMEFLDGKEMKRAMEECGFLDEAQVLKIGLDIAQALDVLHQQGLVHRDIKPENIMIASDGVGKLMDLGLVKSPRAIDIQVTAPGTTLGSPAYMSPEHIQCGSDLDIRTDMYSLGATMFHAVTGTLAYDSANVAVLIAKVVKEPVPDPRSRRTAVSADMAKLLLAMMAKDRKKRYATPAELIRDMQRVMQGRPPQGPVAAAPKPAPPTAPARTSSPVVPAPAPRKRWPAVLLLGAALASAGAVLLWLFKS
jgi:serine/threonine-protein kinase